MTRRAVGATLLALLISIAGRPAAAQNLGGCSAAGPDPAGTFTIAAPVGAPVTVDLTGCPGVTIFAGGPGAIACPPPVRTVTVVAGPGGATFTIGGCAVGPLGAGPGCATVAIGGGLPAPLRIGAFDLNCAGGVGAADISIWIAGFVGGGNDQRLDYDRSGFVGAGDLSRLIQVFVLGGSGATCAPSC